MKKAAQAMGHAEAFICVVPVVGMAVLTARFGGSITGLGSLRPALLVAAGALIVLGLACRVRAGVGGHAHGSNRARVATHEAGHVVAARALGGRVLSAEVYSNGGGLVTWNMPAKVHSAETNVAFLLAGQYAAGTSAGCSGDQAEIRRQLRGMPDAGRVRSRAASRARSIVASHRGEIRRVAAQLDDKGRL